MFSGEGEFPEREERRWRLALYCSKVCLGGRCSVPPFSKRDPHRWPTGREWILQQLYFNSLRLLKWHKCEHFFFYIIIKCTRSCWIWAGLQTQTQTRTIKLPKVRKNYVMYCPMWATFTLNNILVHGEVWRLKKLNQLQI